MEEFLKAFFWFIVGAGCMLLFLWLRSPHDGPKEQAANVYLYDTPTSAKLCELDFLTRKQVIKLAEHVGRGGKMTARELRKFMSEGEVVKLRKVLIPRELVTLSSKGSMIPCAPLRKFLSSELDAKQTKQSRQSTPTRRYG